MRRISYAFAIIALALLASCAGTQPTATIEPGLYYTQAAQTIAAAATLTAANQPAVLPTSTPTPTEAPTSTHTPPPPVSGPSQTPDPCNQLQFLYDVNIPDDTVMSPNQTFTKKWMLRNIGACPWTTGYQLVFISGNAMGGVATPLLAQGSILRGQSVEASVALKAPAAAGTYTGYWALSDAGGNLFKLPDNSFYVRIRVVTTGTITISLGAVGFESGSVTSSGAVGGINVGDTTDKEGVQAFLSFDISTIPARAVINTAALDLSGYELVGDPFGLLGCLDVYQQDFIPLTAGDYFTAAPAGAYMEWCSAAGLSNVVADGDLINAIQSRLGVQTRLQLRLQFPAKQSDGEGAADQVRFLAPYLTVQYTIP
jgi:hypothetical protein